MRSIARIRLYVTFILSFQFCAPNFGGSVNAIVICLFVFVMVTGAIRGEIVICILVVNMGTHRTVLYDSKSQLIGN